MIIDSSEAAQQFKRRFHNCDDGVIRQVHVIFRSGSSRPSRVDVVLSARDSRSKDWVNVSLAFLDVLEFSFNEGNISYQVMSEGLTIIFLDGFIFVNFYPYDN